MSERAGWFDGVEPDGLDGAEEAVESGSAAAPRDWPALAVDAGFAADEDDYYEKLHEATTGATRAAAGDAARAPDQQLKHAVRAMDDADRVAGELAERAVEWGGGLVADGRVDDGLGSGIDGARALTAVDPETPVEDRAVSFARRAVDLAEEAETLRRHVERTAPTVAPNLAEMAGPVLAARLVSLAGGLESLARMPSGTVQVLGAEDALFAHLSGRAPSPKHGVIYTHDAVRGTRPGDRGSAARALAGKLAIAARIDHYAGDFRPEIHEQLRDRMATIRAPAGPGADTDADGTDTAGPEPAEDDE